MIPMTKFYVVLLGSSNRVSTGLLSGRWFLQPLEFVHRKVFSAGSYTDTLADHVTRVIGMCTSKMAESGPGHGRKPYSCHFHFPGPISKVASSRITRYRLYKK